MSSVGDPLAVASVGRCCWLLLLSGETVTYTCIFSHLTKYNIISVNQHGFHSGHSCDTQLLGELHDFHHSFNAGSHIDALFLDFAKAFKSWI